ncbi:putative Cytochrome P450 81D11 [Cocos nucifera]|nr:putative Cytochrome P450 81D11 [Cocos nucifera]
MDLMGVETRIEKLTVKMDRFLAKLIEEQRRKRRMEKEEASGEENAADGRRTLINAMPSLQEYEPEVYSDDLIKTHIMSMLSAGVTNSPETAEAAMRFLLCHPEIMKKARSEIEANLEPSRILEESDLPKFPYLHCIVKETMRLAPSKRGFPPRMPSEDCTIQGYHIPRGTMVFINEWGIQRDPELWDDPLAFKPERFVEDGGRGKGFDSYHLGQEGRGAQGKT